MKKKPPAAPIIAPEIIAPEIRKLAESTGSKAGLDADKPKALKPCVVCDSVRTAPVFQQGPSGQLMEDDGLCWVCRRLKISAWRETEQTSASE